MVRSHGKFSAVQVRVEVIEALYHGEELLSGDAVVLFGLAEFVAVVGHNMFSVVLHLREYCSNPISTSVTVNNVGRTGIRIWQYFGVH